MTTQPIQGLLTAEDLMDMSGNDDNYELVQGVLLSVAAASSKPSIVTQNVGTEVCWFVRRHKLGFCGSAEGGFILRRDPDTVRAPDFSFIAASRVPGGVIPPGFFPGPPDLAVEVISPSNRMSEVLKKVGEYLEAGARLVWVLHPERRTAVVYRPDSEPQVFGADGELSGEDVVPGFTLRLTEIWV